METRTHIDRTRPVVSNKQVVLIFIVGVLMMFVAFWAGLSIIKNSIAPAENQSESKPPAPKQAASLLNSPVTPAASAEGDSDTPTAETRYVIHVAACGTAAEAQKYELELKRAGYLSAYVKQATDGLYHVDIGIYKERQDAQRAANELSLHYKQTMIYQNDKH
jgi:cell division septation protein DedD